MAQVERPLRRVMLALVGSYGKISVKGGGSGEARLVTRGVRGCARHCLRDPSPEVWAAHRGWVAEVVRWDCLPR